MFVEQLFILLVAGGLDARFLLVADYNLTKIKIWYNKYS